MAILFLLTTSTNLVQAGADINARDEIGRTALFAWNEERFDNRDRGAEIISIFLTHGADATATDMDGSTLLHGLTGHISEKNAVRLLVDAGVSINAVTKIDGETPLITATRRNQLMDPTLFHEFDADFDPKDLKGNTALHWACDSWCMEDKHADIWLSFADPTILNNARRPAASNFAWGNGGQGRVDALPKMVKLGLSLESRDYLGRTLLLQFLGGDYIQGSEHFIKMLLSLGADVKSTDYQGKSGKLKLLQLEILH
jgi:ankyrin repeat protein